MSASNYTVEKTDIGVNTYSKPVNTAAIEAAGVVAESVRIGTGLNQVDKFKQGEDSANTAFEHDAPADLSLFSIEGPQLEEKNRQGQLDAAGQKRLEEYRYKSMQNQSAYEQGIKNWNRYRTDGQARLRAAIAERPDMADEFRRISREELGVDVNAATIDVYNEALSAQGQAESAASQAQQAAADKQNKDSETTLRAMAGNVEKYFPELDAAGRLAKQAELNQVLERAGRTQDWTAEVSNIVGDDQGKFDLVNTHTSYQNQGRVLETTARELGGRVQSALTNQQLTPETIEQFRNEINDLSGKLSMFRTGVTSTFDLPGGVFQNSGQQMASMAGHLQETLDTLAKDSFSPQALNDTKNALTLMVDGNVDAGVKVAILDAEKNSGLAAGSLAPYARTLGIGRTYAPVGYIPAGQSGLVDPTSLSVLASKLTPIGKNAQGVNMSALETVTMATMAAGLPVKETSNAPERPKTLGEIHSPAGALAAFNSPQYQGFWDKALSTMSPDMKWQMAAVHMQVIDRATMSAYAEAKRRGIEGVQPYLMADKLKAALDYVNKSNLTPAEKQLYLTTQFAEGQFRPFAPMKDEVARANLNDMYKPYGTKVNTAYKWIVDTFLVNPTAAK
jgi:hypothetical protein